MLLTTEGLEEWRVLPVSALSIYARVFPVSPHCDVLERSIELAVF